MKYSYALALGVALMAPISDGLAINRKRDHPRVVSMPLARSAVPAIRSDGAETRKREPLETILDNHQHMYATNLTLGSPPQTFRVHLDTGSSDLWVNAANSTYCRGEGDMERKKHEVECKEQGTYDADASSTYKHVGDHFNITYIDGSAAAGDYATDTMSISGVTLEDFQFGVAHDTESADGILGIGYPSNEVQVGRAKQAPYANLPQALADAGVINSPAYSLWLNDLNSETGSILFGGMDTERFEGSLSTLPIQKKDGKYTDFLVTLTGVSYNGTTMGENMQQAVLLDSGSTLSYLPVTMTKQLYETVGAEYQPGQNAAFCPCSLRGNKTTLDFTFSEPTIRVPVDQLVLPLNNTAGEPVFFDDGEQMCLFGIAPAGTKTPVLGDTFLRSAYVVYDLGNNEISIAQTRWNVESSNVVEIGTGEEAVPSATKVMMPVEATAGVGKVFKNMARKPKRVWMSALMAPIVATLVVCAV